MNPPVGKPILASNYLPAMNEIRTLDDLDVAGKRVLLRADLNVPISQGKVTSRARIDRLLPTIEELRDKGASIVIVSHLGRPQGQPDAALSLAPVAALLGRALNILEVPFAKDCIGLEAARVVDQLGPGDVALLENLRFHDGEEANAEEFAKALAELGDVYVDDAFSCAHRAHASIDAVARILPSAAGRLMETELDALGSALDDPGRPLAAIIGGNKVSTKLNLLANLLKRVDHLIVGGAMANTFLLAQGYDIGKSLCEPDMIDIAVEIAAAAADNGCRIALPVDAVVALALAEGAATETVAVAEIAADVMMLDIGPASAAQYAAILGECESLIWNGPLGAFEVPPFDKGTNQVARAVAELTATNNLLSVAGGGDTMAALENAGVVDEFSYVSTAGGAFLEWLEGRKLPGVEALRDGK